MGTFENEEDAAYAYNQRAKEIYKEEAILNNLPTDFIGQPPKNEVTVFGIAYENVNAVCEAFGIPRTTMFNRMKRMSLEEAVKEGKAASKIRLNGKSMRQIAEEKGISRVRLAKLIKSGKTSEEAVELLLKEKKRG